MSLSADREFPSPIPVSGVGFFSSDELFHEMNELGVSVFHRPLSMFCPVLCSEKVPAIPDHR